MTDLNCEAIIKAYHNGENNADGTDVFYSPKGCKGGDLNPGVHVHLHQGYVTQKCVVRLVFLWHKDDQ